MNIDDHVLRVGPFKGFTLAQAARMYRDGDRVYDRATALREELPTSLTGLGWFGWYLSHRAEWLTNSGREVVDRDEIAHFMVHRYLEFAPFRTDHNPYATEPFLSWAANLSGEVPAS